MINLNIRKKSPVVIYDDGGIPAEVDNSTHSLQVIDYAHHEIHSGSTWFNETFIDVPNVNVLDIRITTPNTTALVHLHRTFTTEAEFAHSIYEDVSIVTAGTTLNTFNKRRDAGDTNGVTMSYIINADLTDANADTDISGATLLGIAKSGSGRDQTGDNGHSRNELILLPNTTYLFRFENESTATKYVDWVIEWYEHTDKS